MDCCRSHFFTMNGPVPTGEVQFSSWLRFNAVGDSMASQGWESESSRALSGVLSEIRAVWALTAVTLVTLASARYPVDDPVDGFCRWAMFAATASASSGVPSVNFTLSRSVKSQLSPPGASVHLVASHGMILPFLSSRRASS